MAYVNLPHTTTTDLIDQSQRVMEELFRSCKSPAVKVLFKSTISKMYLGVFKIKSLQKKTSLLLLYCYIIRLILTRPLYTVR